MITQIFKHAKFLSKLEKSFIIVKPYKVTWKIELTSFMIFISIQLFVDVVISLKNTGAKLR